MTRILAASAAAGALAWLVMAGGQAGTSADKGSTSVEAAADEAPGYAVENYDYPNADKILAEQNIVLKRGDGHILLADCAIGAGLLEVYSRANSRVCFSVTGNSGWLTLEIPSVYGVRTSAHATELDLTVDAEETSVDIPADTWQAVGESADPEGRPHILVEIRTSK
ncbi:hypothetical protein KQY30_32685 [Streptomyces sp. GMY02]|uniref:hypothetical protein n=1 Tax=Streptomyces sp. GMY02 TaxID=1333528 RepID=UPI001C2BAE25|nr:hypothetical protein [Streptomyces sp. GMY02]QXE38284.1 hypothetical protein KQY30_32685 [Streptomyces sp. GMY02]